MRAAADTLRADSGATSARALGQAIAERVIAQMLEDARHDPGEVRLSALGDMDPFGALAISTSDELAERLWDRMRAFGTFIPPAFQQEAQRHRLANEMHALLAERYAKHLREIILRPRA